MHNRALLLVFTIFNLLLMRSAFAQQAMPMQHNVPGMAAMASPADPAMTSGMEKMQHDMSAAPRTGDPDKDFVAMMIPHHQGAVDMATVELKYGKDQEIRKLATAIVAAQKEEIAQMEKWQANHPAK